MDPIEIEKIKAKPEIDHTSIEDDNLLEIINKQIREENELENIINRKQRYYIAKRVLEIVLLSIIFVPTALLILLISMILFIRNKGEIVFKQKRIGHNEQLFTLYKFKTLKNAIDVNIEKNSEIIKQNTHVFGYFLRKTGLDEILQIVNILKGDMNLIGPRPLLMKDLSHLTQHQLRIRHVIKPGILGLWQIKRNYSDDINFYRYDVLYLKKESLLLDLYITWGTIVYMIRGKGR